MLELSAKGSVLEDDSFTFNLYMNGVGTIYTIPIRYYVPETHSLLTYLRTGGKVIRLKFQEGDQRHKVFAIVKTQIERSLPITNETPQGTVQIDITIQPL